MVGFPKSSHIWICQIFSRFFNFGKITSYAYKRVSLSTHQSNQDQLRTGQIPQWVLDHCISPPHDEGDVCGQFYTYSAQLLAPNGFPTPELAYVHLTESQIGH